MARPRKAQVEGAGFPAVQARNDATGEFQTDDAEYAERFAAALAAFRERFPDDWEAVRLCPTQHGVDIIAAKLKG